VLEYYSGLDLLDTFTPTVLQDPSFEGTTVSTLRSHFDQWAKTARKEKQGDQDAMESVLNAPVDQDETGFIRMVYAEWGPEELDEEDIANGDVDVEEPLEGCTGYNVGWMKLY
ncbi:hypothetical protein N7481_006413, partial [Penicillium waksmanii]|uniref:uncharacterized protein n=1 Tax=Penicillium waksmanii TaxID=69791 RepID=UPI0025465DAA